MKKNKEAGIKTNRQMAKEAKLLNINHIEKMPGIRIDKKTIIYARTEKRYDYLKQLHEENNS
jgi:hypothetical protein